jgi:polyribonucleotide nucleotidyltransferase
MDFKVTGTASGITAIQLDNKVAGLTVGILCQALLEAKKGRIHILNEMKKVIAKPNPEISKYAPGVAVTQVPVEKIGDVIGPSGKIIKGISSKYEVEVEIEDSTGKTLIFGKDKEKVIKAKKTIEKIITGYQAGQVVTGEIYRIESFGAFIDIIEDGEKVGKDGMIHISNLSETRVKDVQSVVKIGDKVECKILSINEKNQLELKFLQKLI